MNKLIFVALGGGAGAVARYLVGTQALQRFGSSWPYGTFIANVAGGLLMGMLAGYLAHRGGADQERCVCCSAWGSWAASPPSRRFRWRRR